MQLLSWITIRVDRRIVLLIPVIIFSTGFMKRYALISTFSSVEHVIVSDCSTPDNC